MDSRFRGNDKGDTGGDFGDGDMLVPGRLQQVQSVLHALARDLVDEG
jgi:hypothetical protein